MYTLASRFFQLNIAKKRLMGHLLYASFTFWLFMKTLAARFFRLNIAKKMLLGYLFYALLTILIALFILSRLEELNRINQSIIKTDIPLLEITDKMIDTLLAQELYGQRSVILRSPGLMPLFWTRNEEFDQLRKRMDALPHPKDFPADRLLSLHAEYNKLFKEGFEYLKDPSSPRAKIYEKKIRGKLDQIIQLLKRISAEARQDQNERSRMTLRIGNTAFRVTAVLCVVGILVGIIVAMIITRSISEPIHQLKLSTQEISQGNFDSDSLPQIHSRDELGDLSHAFEVMVKRLKRLEEMYLDASPLTHLPGGIAIENIVKKRLSDNVPLAFCLLDLANFKAFNDRYGYAKGNEVILATARIITDVVSTQGRDGDFIGHIGGDDFVIITGPDSFEKICPTILDTFDKTILDFYDLEDRKRGSILGKTRQGKEISFPIMTVSIAVVTNQIRDLKSHIQVGEIAAEMKNYAKSFGKSIYVVDRRKDGLPEKV